MRFAGFSESRSDFQVEDCFFQLGKIERTIHVVMSYVQTGESAIEFYGRCEECKPGDFMELGFILAAALAGHDYMTAHVCLAIKVDADVAEAQ